MQKSILVSLCLVFNFCVGCGPQAKSETTPTDVATPLKATEESNEEAVAPSLQNAHDVIVSKTYEKVLDTVYDIASSKPKSINVHDIYVGVKEIAKGAEHGEGLNRIGYIMEDISGDGIPELIIGEINHARPNLDGQILLLFVQM